MDIQKQKTNKIKQTEQYIKQTVMHKTEADKIDSVLPSCSESLLSAY